VTVTVGISFAIRYENDLILVENFSRQVIRRQLQSSWSWSFTQRNSIMKACCIFLIFIIFQDIEDNLCSLWSWCMGIYHLL